LLDIQSSITGVANYQVTNCRRVVADIEASGCSNTALRVEHCSYVGHAIEASACSATPLEMLNVQYSEPILGGLTGSNPDASFGVSISGGGKHLLTGSSLTGNGHLDLDGHTVSWSDLSSENFENAGTVAYWADNRWVRMGRLRILNNSSTPYDDLITASMQYGDYLKQYGVDRPLDPAYKEVTAHSGGGQADAVLVGRQDTLVTAAGANGDSVRLLSSSDAPVMGGGAKGSVWNRTAFSVAVFPPTGKVVYVNGASLGTNTAYSLAAGARVQWLCDNADNYNLSL
jgi:hypothetical protein